MVEFKCSCGGKIFRLYTVKDHFKDAEYSFYGCTKCHIIWWDAPENPLTQEKIEKIFTSVVKLSELTIGEIFRRRGIY